MEWTFLILFLTFLSQFSLGCQLNLSFKWSILALDYMTLNRLHIDVLLENCDFTSHRPYQIVFLSFKVLSNGDSTKGKKIYLDNLADSLLPAYTWVLWRDWESLRMHQNSCLNSCFLWGNSHLLCVNMKAVGSDVKGKMDSICFNSNSCRDNLLSQYITNGFVGWSHDDSLIIFVFFSFSILPACILRGRSHLLS